jgi:hypothetical protein
MIAMKPSLQREILYDSPWISWERVPAGEAKAWIQQIKFYDRWLFLVTDEAGHNYRDSENEEECYRIIEEAFPVAVLVGNRRNGAIEIAEAASKITI